MRHHVLYLHIIAPYLFIGIAGAHHDAGGHFFNYGVIVIFVGRQI